MLAIKITLYEGCIGPTSVELYTPSRLENLVLLLETLDNSKDVKSLEIRSRGKPLTRLDLGIAEGHLKKLN